MYVNLELSQDVCLRNISQDMETEGKPAVGGRYDLVSSSSSWGYHSPSQVLDTHQKRGTVKCSTMIARAAERVVQGTDSNWMLDGKSNETRRDETVVRMISISRSLD